MWILEIQLQIAELWHPLKFFTSCWWWTNRWTQCFTFFLRRLAHFGPSYLGKPRLQLGGNGKPKVEYPKEVCQGNGGAVYHTDVWTWSNKPFTRNHLCLLIYALPSHKYRKCQLSGVWAKIIMKEPMWNPSSFKTAVADIFDAFPHGSSLQKSLSKEADHIS